MREVLLDSVHITGRGGVPCPDGPHAGGLIASVGLGAILEIWTGRVVQVQLKIASTSQGLD